MFITNKTIITFMPEEQGAIKSFLETNDITKWKEDVTTVGISYVKTDHYYIHIKEEADNRTAEQI